MKIYLLDKEYSIDQLENMEKKAQRYDWLSEHPSASVSVYSGKYRVCIGNSVVTEWFDTREEAIDNARGVVE